MPAARSDRPDRGAAAVIVVLIAIALAGCGSSDASGAKAKASSIAAAASRAAASAVATAKAIVGTPVPISIVNGKVTAPDVVHLKKGDKVRLVVISDKADEVHVHLDDSHHPLEANKPTIIDVTADKAGRFEVETDPASKILTILEVK